MKIPKRFQLGPHTILVRLVSDKEMLQVAKGLERLGGDKYTEAPWGLFVRGENALYVLKVRFGFCASQQLHTFWHEFYHALFFALNRDEQALDELFVDQCGLLLMQMQQTAKY